MARKDEGTGQPTAPGKRVMLASVRPTLAAFIRAKRPDLGPDASIDLDTLDDLRGEYVRSLLEQEVGEVSRLEEEVIRSLSEHELVTEREDRLPDRRGFGERVADRIATWGGSWAFILSFAGFLLAWIAVNAWWLAGRSFDPYPFILLNLLLSCLAAVQAPVILMSQKRQEARDRARAEQDYKVNLKAELEIRHLHEKLDHLLRENTQRLLEIQQVQLDLLRDLNRRG